MNANPALRTGISLAITVAVAYSACALLFWLLPDAATSFMNGLFHGLDFRKLQGGGAAFDFGGFAAALALIAVWAFLVGAVFGYTYDRYGRRPG